MAILAFAFLFLGWSAVFILASLVFGVLWYSDEIQNKYPKVGKCILTIRSWSAKFLLGLNSLFSIIDITTDKIVSITDRVVETASGIIGKIFKKKRIEEKEK